MGRFIMSQKKKLVRAQFRASVFSRDKFKCKMCDFVPKSVDELDAHHITDRRIMPNGGYVMENGIALCPECHIKAETEYSIGMSYPEYSTECLYKAIDSNYDKAVEASKKLE